jgi:hypothetical protein
LSEPRRPNIWEPKFRSLELLAISKRRYSVKLASGLDFRRTRMEPDVSR